MPQQELNDSEVDSLIENVKEMDISEERKTRKIELYEAMRPEKKQEVKLATEEEVDALFGSLVNSEASAVQKPKNGIENEIDKIYGTL